MSLYVNQSKKTVLFGANTFASMSAYCLKHDAGRDIAGFTVDREYALRKTHDGLPLVAFDEIVESFPPDSHELLFPVGYLRMNALRTERLDEARCLGYRIGNYVSSQACVYADLKVEENVFLFERCIIQPHARVGRNVLIRSGAIIGHHAVVHENAFVAAGAVTGGSVSLGANCFIGLGALIRDGVTIGDGCFVGAGAVVIGDTEEGSVYVGNPARRLAKTALEVSGG